MKQLISTIRWLFSLTGEDYRRADALADVLMKDLVFRLLIEAVLAVLFAFCGLPVFALVWLALIIPAEFGESILTRFKARADHIGPPYLYAQYVISLCGGGIWSGVSVYLWMSGNVVLMATGVFMLIGVTIHVGYKYYEWTKAAIIAGIPPFLAIVTMGLAPLPFEVSLAERLLLVQAVAGLIYYMITVARANIKRQYQLRKAVQDASGASQTKSIFLANVSHEIRTPMNGVLAMAELLERTELNPAQREMVNIIQISGDSLLRVIDDILDLSKIEAGHITLEPKPFSPSDLVRSLVSTFTVAAQEKGLSLRFRCAPPDDLYLVGDVFRFRQVIGNLLSNAIKFTEEGTITLSVEALPVDNSDDYSFRVVVSDTGRGMNADDVQRVFQPFVQADESRSRRFGGTGLGLAISRDVVQRMGGTLIAESVPGEGSRFIVTCPLKGMHKGDFAEISISEDANADGVARSDTRPSILVAEDHPFNRRVLELTLGTMDADLTFAVDGIEAVKACENEVFDLVLMDIQMPQLDGVEALQQIRLNETRLGRPPVSVYALTANAMEHQVAEYYAAGFDGHLAKPIRIEDLHAVVSGVRSGT